MKIRKIHKENQTFSMKNQKNIRKTSENGIWGLQNQWKPKEIHWKCAWGLKSNEKHRRPPRNARANGIWGS